MNFYHNLMLSKISVLIFLSAALIPSSIHAAIIRDVTAQGAKGDGVTLNTQAIQAVIDACAPGDTVLIPSGTFISGALFLKSDMALEIDGTLKGSTDIKDYPLIPCRYEGFELSCYASLVTLGKRDRTGPYNISNVVITGTGTIDGSGLELGPSEKKTSGNRSRGRAICIMNAQNIIVRGLTVSWAPAWTVHAIYSDGLVFDHLKLISKGPKGRIANGDGIDPDSSTNVKITNCYFHTGDDSIAIKSGKDLEGYTVAKPTEHVDIENCTVDGSEGGIVIGSEMSGSVRDVLVNNCTISHLSWAGLDIKSSVGRGGTVENVRFKNVTISKVDEIIRITTAYKVNNDGTPAPVPPTLKNVQYENIVCTTGSTSAIVVRGLPNSTISDIHFLNCNLAARNGVTIDNGDGISFANVTIKNDSGPKYTVTNSKNVLGAEN